MFFRPEKSEALSKKMENLSGILQHMQETCHNLSKGIKEGIPNFPGEPEKRTVRFANFHNLPKFTEGFNRVVFICVVENDGGE